MHTRLALCRPGLPTQENSPIWLRWIYLQQIKQAPPDSISWTSLHSIMLTDNANPHRDSLSSKTKQNNTKCYKETNFGSKENLGTGIQNGTIFLSGPSGANTTEEKLRNTCRHFPWQRRSADTLSSSAASLGPRLHHSLARHAGGFCGC